MSLPQPFNSFTQGMCLCLILILVWSVADRNAIAGEVKSLYSADIPVQTQAESERIRAAKQALQIVFTKVTGRQSTSSQPELAPALKRPMQFVQQYHYIALTEDEQTMLDAGEISYQQQVRFEFDSKAVNRELANAGVPIWGRARPSTLVWLAVEAQGQRLIVGGEQLIHLRQIIEEQSEQRGLPVLFPLLDLQDQSAVQFTDLWGDFQDNITLGSARYQAEGVLVGRLYQLSGQEWQARWSLYVNDMAQRWTSVGVGFQPALAAGINQLAEIYADLFALQVSEDGKQRITMEVSDITTLPAYSRATQYLQSLDMIKDLMVEQIIDDHVLYSFTLRGELAGLQQAIAFGDVLIPGPAKHTAQTMLSEPRLPDLSLPPSLQTEAKTPVEVVTKPLSAMLHYRLLP